jgi:hypothetical protein
VVTDQARRKRITDALSAMDQRPGPKETVPLQWRGEQMVMPVIQLDLDVALLNARSHRLKAQLEDHPERDLVQDHPWEEEAQEVVAELLKSAHREYEALKANLAQEGQRDPGFVTRDGVLINANSRAVALRELNDPNRRWIRVGVLPPDADAQELAELELRLQVQKELKDPYPLMNELLFIEDMARTFSKSSDQIAIDLRWATSDARSLKKGASEVEQRRRILALIREMQQLSDPPVELTFFDDKLEQLKALETKYSALLNEDPESARRFRDNWLCAARAGSSSVHDLRAVDEDFVEDFLRPRLAEDDELAPFVDALLAPSAERATVDPPGVDVLDPERERQSESDTDVRRLISVFSSKAPVTLIGADGKKFTLDAETVRDRVRLATNEAIKDFNDVPGSAD